MRPELRDFRQAMELGPLALIRLRAEVILQRYYHQLPPDHRDELDRIATDPKPDDAEYLSALYPYLKGEIRP